MSEQRHCELECSTCSSFVHLSDVRKFVKDCLSCLGVVESKSNILAEAIVQADYKGVFSEGVTRLEKYVQEIEEHTCDPNAEPAIESQFASVAVVKGNNGLGPVIGKFCMDIAIEKALSTGIGMVVAKGSNHYGMSSLYTVQASKKGLIGLSFTNDSPTMVPPGALDAILGTNPLSLAAPSQCEDLIVDMATTAVTLPKIEEYKRNKVKLPKGWAVNKMGQVEEDAEKALFLKMLAPMGGDQNYKGYGLAILVEVLSGLLADSNYGPKIPKNTPEPPNLGHGFIVIDPQKFVPDFPARLSILLNHLRNMEPSDPDKPVLVPGDKQHMHMKKVDCEGGVYYSNMQTRIMGRLCKKFNVKPISTFTGIPNLCRITSTIQMATVVPHPQSKVEPAPIHCCAAKSATANCAAAKKGPGQEVKTGELITSKEEAYRFMMDCLKAVGISQEIAEIVVQNLLTADSRGFYSHGMNRLENYIKDINNNMCDPNAVCTIEKESASAAVVNGNNGFGAVVGKYCMDLALEKARETGIALVVARGSNHYGIAGLYALQAVNKGFLGMSFTNTSPYMTPTRAKEAALGTNPLSLGAPGLNGDNFVLDMTTTSVAVGKIELLKRKGLPIPEGWALNNEGKVETNAEVAFKAGKLMPVGGHKGYCLGLLVDILSGVLSGGKYGPFVRKWGVPGEIANLGHAFIAINPKCFAPGFEDRLSNLMSSIRNMESLDPSRPIAIHGDMERAHEEKVKKDGGFLYVQNQHDTNSKLAADLKVTPMVSRRL